MYLGLVLVGATPVLGHAATTRVFEISDEIEIKDDLDRKPDDESELDAFSSSFEELVRVAIEWSAANAPDGSLDELLSFNHFLSVKPSGSSRRVSHPDSIGREISLGRNSRALVRLYDAFLDRDATWHDKFLVQFGFGLGEISLKTAILQSGPEAADIAANAYSKALARKLAAETSAVRAVIFRSTQVTAEGDRVILVTRLPRAALEPLLANDAK